MVRFSFACFADILYIYKEGVLSTTSTNMSSYSTIREAWGSTFYKNFKEREKLKTERMSSQTSASNSQGAIEHFGNAGSQYASQSAPVQEPYSPYTSYTSRVSHEPSLPATQSAVYQGLSSYERDSVDSDGDSIVSMRSGDLKKLLAKLEDLIDSMDATPHDDEVTRDSMILLMMGIVFVFGLDSFVKILRK